MGPVTLQKPEGDVELTREELMTRPRDSIFSAGRDVQGDGSADDAFGEPASGG